MADTTQISDLQRKNELALADFVIKLIDERKDPKLKAEDLPSARALLLQEAHEHINRALIRALNDTQQIQLGKYLDLKPTAAELDTFFEQKIENMDVVIAQALLEFRNAYLAAGAQSTMAVEAKEEVKKEDFSMPLPAPVRF